MQYKDHFDNFAFIVPKFEIIEIWKKINYAGGNKLVIAS